MVRSLQVLRGEVRSRLLDLRNLSRLIEQEAFQKTFAIASIDERAVVQRLVDSGDKYSLELWLRRQLRDSALIEELPISELREMCGELGVRGYRHMTKQALISNIRRVRNNEQDRTASTDRVKAQ